MISDVCPRPLALVLISCSPLVLTSYEGKFSSRTFLLTAIKEAQGQGLTKIGVQDSCEKVIITEVHTTQHFALFKHIRKHTHTLLFNPLQCSPRRAFVSVLFSDGKYHNVMSFLFASEATQVNG